MTRRKHHQVYVPQGIGVGGYSVSGGTNSRWDGLVAGWHLNETSDGSAPVAREDVLGTYTLTDTNTTPSGSGILGNAASPNKANSEYLIYSSGGTPFWAEGAAFTVVFWVYLPKPMVTGWSLGGDNGTPNQHALAAYAFSTTNYRIFIQDTGGTYSIIDNVPGASPDAGWYQFIAWYDSAVDGKVRAVANAGTVQVASGALGAAARAHARFAVGAQPNGSNFGTFLVDEAYIFAGALGATAAWRTDMYNGGVGRSYPN